MSNSFKTIPENGTLELPISGENQGLCIVTIESNYGITSLPLVVY
jgi:hypothetical protein